MAFDYGSIDLGLKNPFKLEGKVTATRGLIQSLIGIYLLVSAASIVKDDTVVGWIFMAFGVFILGGGIKALSSGIYATLRYFVGRNHPTSLAKNFSKSESSSAQEESSYVGYNAQQLEEMLVGRKNITFLEPIGFLARLIHSFIPKLLFMPYPIRNMAQRLLGAWTKTLVSLVSFALVAFVTLSGFAGEAGELVFPIYSAIITFYVLYSWRVAARPLSRNAEMKIETLGGAELTKIIAVSLIMPVVVGVILSWVMSAGNTSKADIEGLLEAIPSLHASYYLIFVLSMATICSVVIFSMLRKRLQKANPVSEVSELRENWQESIHPNEIFINLDNLVMANRRFKEVPNRVYRELDPQLREQVEGKGDFKGEMIQEIQPKVKVLELGATFIKMRLISLIMGNVLFIASVIIMLILAYTFVDIYSILKITGANSLKGLFDSKNITEILDLVMSGFHLFLIGFLLKSFGRLLSNVAHLFFAEIQFESLLVYFKCEGTFTESKISTGTGIHDSTRSENTLIRSSITPWIVVSKIITSTFAATGMKNLEHPRHILEMHKDDEQLQDIRSDVIAFLKDRESIATITSVRDLDNASQIHQLNEQTRAIPTMKGLAHDDEEAAGYLREKKNDNK